MRNAGVAHGHLGDWTCDCGRVECGFRSRCLECGTHVTEREVEA